MELKEIKAIVSDIIQSIDTDKFGCTYRGFLTFVTGAGNRTPRNLELLKKFDYQFKKQGIMLYCGGEERKSIFEFSKYETVTFRKNGQEPTNVEEKHNGQKLAYKHAGTIDISTEESGITLYKHQEEAVEKLQTKIIRSNKNSFEGLLVLPTGGGKTLTAAYWIAKNYLDKGKKVLWVAHRHELLEQAQRTFHKQLSYKDILPNRTKLNYRIISGIHDKPVNIRSTDDIIISSKDSLNAGFDHLYNNWLKGSDTEIFLVIDEAHHATAKTYRKLIKNLRERVGAFRLLGLTATPFRTAEDEQGLLAKVFPDDIVYKIDLRTLISRGILSEPIFEEVQTEFDMTRYLDEEQLDKLKYFDIDSIGRGTAQTIAENDQRNWSIVNRYVSNKGKYRQTIVFALNVFNAIALNKLFQEQGIKSDFVISTVKDMATGVNLKKDNSEIIDRFRKGELEVIINVNILTEGTDIPNVQSVFLARPTISPILMTQMIGRGLRGERAGGTKDAYIVSFIDEWREKVAWVNPEKLLIEENVDFSDKQADTNKQLIRLVAISKVEEFASLTNKTIAAEVREELEKLDFIERIPLGIYHFSILQSVDSEAHEKNCEVLVYDNICQSYNDFIVALPKFFEAHKLTDKEALTEDELEKLSEVVEEKFFYGSLKYPAYYIQDIKDILQYYTQNGVEPKYIELKERSKYDIGKIAQRILYEDMGHRAAAEYKSQLWDSNETEWKAFFGFDKRYFLNEIDLSIRRLSNPDLYGKASTTATVTKETRPLNKFSMSELRELTPEYWKQLSDAVFAKYRDEEGNYVSASGEYKGKNKLSFQIDHILPMHNGGLTELDNLQLLTRSENGLKGAS